MKDSSKPSNSHSRSPSRTSPEKMSLNATFASRSWLISWIVWRGFNSDLVPKIVGICKTASEPHFLQSSKPSNNHSGSSLRTSPERMSLNAAFASRSWLMSWIVWGGASTVILPLRLWACVRQLLNLIFRSGSAPFAPSLTFAPSAHASMMQMPMDHLLSMKS